MPALHLVFFSFSSWLVCLVFLSGENASHNKNDNDNDNDNNNTPFFGMLNGGSRALAHNHKKPQANALTPKLTMVFTRSTMTATDANSENNQESIQGRDCNQGGDCNQEENASSDPLHCPSVLMIHVQSQIKMGKCQRQPFFCVFELLEEKIRPRE